MERPTPEAYGLSSSEVPLVRQARDRSDYIGIGIGAMATGCLLGGAAIRSGVADQWQAGDVVAALLVLTGPFGVALLIGAVLGLVIARTIRRIADPRVTRYQRFEEAMRTFESWRARTLAEFWHSLSGRRFEQELACLFGQEGYRVELTPTSGDAGIDIVLRRDGRTILVQCKRTRTPIGPSAARELYGALVAAKADEAILACVSGATRGVYEFAKGKPLRVMDLHEIIALHKKHG
jgi:restriction system protein